MEQRAKHHLAHSQLLLVGGAGMQQGGTQDRVMSQHNNNITTLAHLHVSEDKERNTTLHIASYSLWEVLACSKVAPRTR